MTNFNFILCFVAEKSLFDVIRETYEITFNKTYFYGDFRLKERLNELIVLIDFSFSSFKHDKNSNDQRILNEFVTFIGKNYGIDEKQFDESKEEFINENIKITYNLYDVECSLFNFLGIDTKDLTDDFNAYLSYLDNNTSYNQTFEHSSIDFDNIYRRVFALLNRKYQREKKNIEEEIINNSFFNHICLVCQRKPATTYVTPCYHTAMCEECLRDSQMDKNSYVCCFKCKELVQTINRMT